MEYNEKRNGGRAFPTTLETPIHGGGMYLRDYFAVKALNALLSKSPIGQPIILSEITSKAYCLADQMLIERDKRSFDE